MSLEQKTINNTYIEDLWNETYTLYSSTDSL